MLPIPGSCCLAWRGGTHQFCIASSGIMLALEQSRGVSVSKIYARLASGRWYVNDMRETIRLGLIGGGMAPNEAIAAVRGHVDDAPCGLLDGAATAVAVLEALFSGMPDEIVGTVAKEGPASESKVSVFHEDGRLKRSTILALGAGLGWSPDVTYAASIWEIAACIDGHNRVNGGMDKVEPPSNDEFDEMLARHNVHQTVQ